MELNREICRAIDCSFDGTGALYCKNCGAQKRIESLIHQSNRAAVERYDKALLWTSANLFLPANMQAIPELSRVIGCTVSRRQQELSALGIGIGGKEGEAKHAAKVTAVVTDYCDECANRGKDLCETCENESNFMMGKEGERG